MVSSRDLKKNSSSVKKSFVKKQRNVSYEEEAVRFVDVKKSFLKKNNCKNSVLSGLSFVIKKKNITAILGPSGTGKTTIARIINGLDEYDEGKVFIGGELLTKKNQRKIRKKTAFVFQNFNLFPHMSILENIIYSPVNVLKQDRDSVLMKAVKMLKQFNLEHKMDCLPHELSGGQKQRVAIIRALILEPEILIMDEPTASLDPELTNDVVSTIFSIRAADITVIIITHDIVVAKKAADDIIMIYGGKCVDSMDAKTFFDKSSKKHFYSQRFLKNCE